MHITGLILTAGLAAMPVPQKAVEAPPPFDFEAAIEEAAARVVAEDARLWVQVRDETGRFVAAGQADEENGYFSMLYGNSYDPSVLSFLAASAIEMYSASDLRTQCSESTIVSCSDPFPGSVQTDAMVTAGVYAGVTALQRLARTQWSVEMSEGWKNVLIWGSMAAVRGFLTTRNISDANALRSLGR